MPTTWQHLVQQHGGETWGRYLGVEETPPCNQERREEKSNHDEFEHLRTAFASIPKDADLESELAHVVASLTGVLSERGGVMVCQW